MKPVQYHYGGFPPKQLNLEKLIPLIGPTNAAVARYDSLLSVIPNAAVLLSPLTTQEAVLSSRIEGTQATMGEVMEYEAEGDKNFSEEKKVDIQEVLNYRKGMLHAMNAMGKLPLSQRVILQVHEILMDSVRGHSKSPGVYRKIPNWIGPAGCTLETASYVPISADKLTDAMSDFEKYIHLDRVPDRLIQLAVMHAEFESVHPFLDGNGRLGRMLVPLFLWEKELINQPMFYISSFLEANRDEYYDRLLAVSRDGSWTEWCEFFLKAVQTQAASNEAKARAILELYNNKKLQMAELTHSQYSIIALDWIFQRPIFKSSDFIHSVDIPNATAKRIIIVFRKNDLLKTLEEAAGSRSAVYAFSELLNIAEGRDVF
ncbi:MAG: Fic family protein [Candidatus Cloacimonetes bacterium]|jgi:Fic family protein|nr:Fic family protein [Candidatus Cloacimonadota bacterium]